MNPFVESLLLLLFLKKSNEPKWPIETGRSAFLVIVYGCLSGGIVDNNAAVDNAAAENTYDRLFTVQNAVSFSSSQPLSSISNEQVSEKYAVHWH